MVKIHKVRKCYGQDWTVEFSPRIAPITVVRKP